MYIACTKNHGIDYLQVHESYSVKENGATKNRSRLIRNLGPLSRFDDGNPDYLKRLRQSFKDGIPLIDSLADLAVASPKSKTITVHFDKDVPDECFSNPKNVGYFLLDALYDALGIRDILARYKSDSKIKYDVNGLLKLLVFGRVLNPDSKSETWGNMDRYVFGVTSSENLVETYRTLACLHVLSESIQKRIHHKIASGVGRSTNICF